MALLAMAACGSPDILLPDSPEPFLFVVLTPTETAPADSGLPALLLTTGTPTRSEYRAAERFEMRAISDGTGFVWYARGPGGVAPVDWSEAHITFQIANYYLPSDGQVPYGGLLDLQSGETYDLFVETRQRLIRGTVTIPGPIDPRVSQENGATLIRWSSVPGAAGYSASAFGLQARLSTDTFYVVPNGAGLPPRRDVVVKALDPNLYAYIVDVQSAREGIDAGFGVFGAFTTATLLLDP